MAPKREVTRMWECGACNGLHKFEHEAEACCAPMVTRVWVCPACEDTHDREEDAETCCPIIGEIEETVSCPSCRRDHSVESLNYQAVKIAGHCTTCNPLFTHDQQSAIEDLHYLVTGRSENINA